MHRIEHDDHQRTFVMPVDGQNCVLEYDLDDSVMTITHTRVPDALGGRGLAGEITRHALEHASANQWRVIAQCSYVAAYIKRHPEYSSLLFE